MLSYLYFSYLCASLHKKNNIKTNKFYMNMRKYSLLLMGLALALGSCSYDDEDIWNKVNELDSRLTAVEATVSQVNSNITALQTVVDGLKGNVYVASYLETNEGYEITFTDGRKVTIYNGTDGNSPYIGENHNWWIGTTDTGISALATDGASAHVGANGHWYVGDTDTGINAAAQDGITPTIGANGNWWIGTTDTGVRAAAQDGLTPTIGDNGNWYFGTEDTGKPAVGKDGVTPRIGANGNWWIGGEDTGKSASGQNGLTPHIGDNGNWFIGDTDTGIKATGLDSGNMPIIGVDTFEGNYYWTQTINGATTWLLDANGNKIPVGGFKPIFKVDLQGYLVYSYDGGITWINVYNVDGTSVKVSGECNCTQFFQNVYVNGNYLYIILIDGTELKIKLDCCCDNCDDTPTPQPCYTGIPDDPTTPTPDLTMPTTIAIPNPHVTVAPNACGTNIGYMDMTGIQDPNTGEWITLAGTGNPAQNVWLEIDGTPRGLLVMNLEESTTVVKNDVVFTVDNSGSMDQEADAIANSIEAWANSLTSKGLDVRYGVVGYGGNVWDEEENDLVDDYGVTGAMDISSVTNLVAFLSRGTGTDRTKGYYGTNASTLQSTAAQPKWNRSAGENGAQAIRFANENFNFRAAANRVYVNFTDDCNFPGLNHPDISVEYFNNQTNWPVENGTIHSVISQSQDYITQRTITYHTPELPWRMSDYTNGTRIFIQPDASDLHLELLTFSQAITHSYIMRFVVPESLLDGQEHQLRIVVIANGDTARGELTFSMVLGSI